MGAYRLDVSFRGGVVTNRASRKGSSSFDGLAADIARTSEPSASSRNVHSEIRFLEQHDYGQPLRNALGSAEVRQIVAEARRTVWPHLNDESVRLVSPAEFTRFWSGLGVQFRLAKLKGAAGLALLGFYVRKMGGSKLPLICVNTAHHPAAIGAAFCHEMGHHLIARLFDSRRHDYQFLTYTAYGEHLSDSEELAADILVSLGVFPEAFAREIFLKPEKRKAARAAADELPHSVSAAVLKYFEGRYGLSFEDPLPSASKLQYLAAVIHFAKLRHALLTEYSI
jgi:hypothetical protein